jgi:ABC-type uncharacterized transport system substrate-binding protein
MIHVPTAARPAHETHERTRLVSARLRDIVGRNSRRFRKVHERSMIRSLRRAVRRVMLLAFAALAIPGGSAFAHPHVWVTMKSEVVYAPDGSVTGVRHAWSFDEMFSTFATQGLETKQKGVFTREDLKPLAEVNVTSLKEFDYFTKAKANSKKVEFKDPVDYYLEFTEGALTLHFFLPLKAAVKAQTLTVEIYDPTWFVDFSFAEKDPVALAGAPAQCKVAVVRSNDAAVQGQQLGEAFFNSLSASSDFGAQLANKIGVKCP